MRKESNKPVSRKRLLASGSLALAAVFATTLTKKVRASKKTKKTKRKMGMVIDLRRCTGCHACSIACKAEFNVNLGKWRSWVKIVEKGNYPNVKSYFLPRVCNQCSKPPCVSVCPSRASHINHSYGIVEITDKICIGCKSCMAMCPYDSRFINPIKKVAEKCDFCIHLIKNGVVPACVNTCPAKTRIFGDLNDPKSEIRSILATNPVQTLNPELGTEPNVFYIGGDITSMRTLGGGKHNA